MKTLFTALLAIRPARLLLLVFIALTQHVSAQSPAPVCGSTEIFLDLMKDQNLKKRYEDADKKLRQLSTGTNTRNAATSDAVFTIPIVVHVFEYTSTPMISDTEIQEAIGLLNKAFRRQLPNPEGVDTEIQFQLAARTPDNKETNGIVRVDASHLPKYVTYGANGNDGEPAHNLMALSSWSNMDYYNVWVVHQLNVFVGFAYYPTGGPTLYDGTMISRYFLNTRTFVHELGHGLNLRHTFAYAVNGGDTDAATCPPNVDCTTDGDGICDTAPMNQSAGNHPDCAQNEVLLNPCTGTTYGSVLRNYMSYQFDHCKTQFTNDQRTKMRQVILTLRPTLHDNESLLPPDPLPVTLVDFTGRQSENSVVLNWSTSAESNNDYFAVEHSADARDFKAVGRVQGRGDTHASLSAYEFVHIPDNQSAIHYYRLKQVDIDGTYAYSGLIHIAFPAGHKITMVPNPVEDHLMVEGITGNWKAEIFSTSGRFLFESHDQKRIDVKRLTPGLYVIEITPKKGSAITGKILKLGK
ncbi:zinc-dependent metalloprotease [Dyadobacter sp. MSC1_007]|jgi:hypothetical protein|uniref:zinc-dependent metalloprotease n=1 Tax=Dyadobacter sp. MSC1_007 TaxID=2909264 RepID=UPI002030CDA1|nr:zinc-dependent metalloprotease [Dyadobacter sp. MSC1_007]